MTGKFIESGDKGGYIYYSKGLYMVHAPVNSLANRPYAVGFETLEGARESLYYQYHLEGKVYME